MVNGEFYPGGVASALELQGDKMTAIYLDRREPLLSACRLRRQPPVGRRKRANDTRDRAR